MLEKEKAVRVPGFLGLRMCARASGEERGGRWGVCGDVQGEWRTLELPESFVQGHPWGKACTF